jgi:hypothetical protein
MFFVKAQPPSSIDYYSGVGGKAKLVPPKPAALKAQIVEFGRTTFS